MSTIFIILLVTTYIVLGMGVVKLLQDGHSAQQNKELSIPIITIIWPIILFVHGCRL